MHAIHPRIVIATVALLVIASPVRPEEPAAPGTTVVPGGTVGPDEATETPDADEDSPCDYYEGQRPNWLDRSQVEIYRTVCGLGAWFDGFFGDSRYDQSRGQTYGRFGIGGFWDERDGFDPKAKLRARFALPAMREWGNVFIGTGDEEQIIEERSGENFEDSVQAISQEEDDALFAGFGFRRSDSLERGFEFDLGARLRVPVEYFAKAKYRYGWQLDEANLLRLRPLLYWRSDERFGATMAFDFDHIVSDTRLLRWSGFGNVSKDRSVEGTVWGTDLTLYQVLTNKRALTNKLFVRGETEAAEKLQNFGYELRYRRRVYREWLFVEYTGSVSWPKEFPTEERDTNFGVGLRFEAYFGPAPEDWIR